MDNLVICYLRMPQENQLVDRLPRILDDPLLRDESELASGHKNLPVR
jgi:hypothetical protein